MYCPQCGTTQAEGLKFCKQCGANLYAVRQVMLRREAKEKFDWSKTWVAEMLMSEEEQLKREKQLEELRGITPEVKRANEIKAGVITSSVGIGLMIFLYIFMQGIVASGKVQMDTAEILSRLWVAGVIPFFVGIGLMINGIVVSKKLIESADKERLANTGSKKQGTIGKNTEQLYLQSPGAPEFISSEFSVTEETTKQLKGSGQQR